MQNPGQSAKKAGMVAVSRWRVEPSQPCFVFHSAHVEPSARKLNALRNQFSPNNLHSTAGLPAATWLNCAHRLTKEKNEKNRHASNCSCSKVTLFRQVQRGTFSIR